MQALERENHPPPPSLRLTKNKLCETLFCNYPPLQVASAAAFQGAVLRQSVVAAQAKAVAAQQALVDRRAAAFARLEQQELELRKQQEEEASARGWMQRLPHR